MAIKLRPLDYSPTLQRGFVYGIRCGDFVKIGKAVNVEKRLDTLRLYNPFPCEVMAHEEEWERGVIAGNVRCGLPGFIR